MPEDPTEKARYFPKTALQLRPDVEGAKMWAVGLEKTLFTYFEVEPHSRFEWHAHESEQITMVLDGALFFEVDTRTICVEAGEVIAIPSSVPHAVSTRERPARAVDAWSPIPPHYDS